MTDFTDAWQWPQWTALIFLVLHVLINASRDGEEKRETAGLRKGEVEKHSFSVSLIRAAIWLFILVAGGFYA